MAKIKGICRNEECDLIDEVQEAEKSNFVCKNCGKPLYPFGNGGAKSGGSTKNWKLIGIIAAAVILIALITLFSIRSCNNTGKTGGMKLVLNHETMTLQVGESDTLVVDGISSTDKKIKWRPTKNGVVEVKDGVVKALKEGEGKVLVQLVDNKKVKAICVYTVVEKTETPTPIDKPQKNQETQSPQPKRSQGSTGGQQIQEPPTSQPSGQIDLGYASYQGGKNKNGQPEGNGALHFKQSHEIIPGSGDVASPGESVVGQFRDGKLVFGTWYKNDGNKKIIKR